MSVLMIECILLLSLLLLSKYFRYLFSSKKKKFKHNQITSTCCFEYFMHNTNVANALIFLFLCQGKKFTCYAYDENTCITGLH